MNGVTNPLNLIRLLTFSLLVVLSLHLPKVLAADKVFSPGSVIINMGVLPQTAANGLKPYGLIYELAVNQQIPVDWSISPTKAQDGIDFTVDGVNYRGGSFIIAADFVAEASAILSTWQAKGVVISSPTSSSFTAPIISSITSFPNAVLDLDRGSLVVPYYESAEIPSSSYRMGLPSDLNSCDDFYAMPHADPAWATHQNLLPFIENGGHLWAACHAVSVLESLENPVDPTENFHFLSNDGLIIFGGHEAGTLPYSQAIPNSPMAQYMGKIDLATENGSEQIYLPVPGSGWRSTTNIGVWDPDHPDVPANSPGKAVKLAWGRAFGDSNAGMVMYEGGHSHAKGTADDVNAQRVYFSSLLHAGVEKRPNIEMITAELPSDIDEGDAISLGVTVTEGSGLYTYQWKSTCGGTFSNPNGATTTFTAPETNVDMPCTIRGVVSDVCGRTSYYAKGAIIHPVFLSDLQITKTDNADPVGTGETINYTLTVVNAGPDTAPNVVVTDDLTATNTTFVSASGSGWSCNNNSGVVSCTVASLPVGTSTINLAVTAPVFATTVNNTASVSSDATEVDPANNSATESTGVKARVDLAINKFIGPKPEVLAGEDYSYFMNVDNVNGAEASTEIIMTDVLPVGAEYVSASGIGWSCGYDISTRTVICTLPGGLASGATADIIELVVTSTEGGDYVNTASVDAPESFDTNSANNSDSATRTVAAVTALEINKLINNANPVDNEAIVFTLLLTNNGPSTATDIRVTDPVPPYVAGVQSGFDGVSSPDNGSTTPNGGSVALTQTNNVLQWDITQLDVGETVALTIDATYQRATIPILGGTVDDGLVENTATIFEFGSYGVPQVVDPNLFDNLDTASVGSPEADVGVSKIATKDATVPSPISVSELDRNDSFSYVIDVVNNGSSDLSIRLAGTLQTDLQVVDTLPEEVTFVDLTNTDAAWSCLTAGVPVTVTCDYRPSADETFANGSSLPPIVINAIAPADTGDLTNQVAVKYTNSEVNERVDNNSVNDSFTLVTPVTAPQVDLALSKVVDNATPAIGETVTYTITVDNTTGPDDATGLQISDTLPVGVTQLTATASVGSYNGGVWAIGDLPFGSSANLIITAKVDNPEQITNTAEITAFNEVDPTPESPKSAVIDVPDADLQLTKVVSAAPVAPNSAPLTVGQSVEFTITLENNGSVDGLGSQVATNVVVTDVLPNGLTIVDAGTDITTSVGTATLDASGSVITWNIPAIAVGAGNKQAMVIKARVDSNATLVNNASVTASDLHDAITANNSDSATVDVIEADLNVTKTFVNDRVVYPDDTAEFTIEVTNNGPDTATGVQLLDTMTPGLSVTVPAADISVTSGSFIYNASAGTIDWTVGNVAIGATQTMTVKANVSQTGTLRNSAEISASDQSDANPNNNYDTVTVLSGGNADLFLTKQIDDPSVTIGDTVTFTLEIVNNGPDSATNIVVQDVLPSDLSNISGTPSAGLFNPANGIWDGFSLVNGEKATLVITAQVDASGQYSNVGLILGSDQGDPDATSDIAKSLYEVFPAGTLNQLSGFVYFDANDNGSYDGEGAVNQNTYVKLISDLDPDYAVEIASVDPTTGAYIFDGVPDGNYQLVVDDNNFSSDVTASAPNSWLFRTPSNGQNTITVAGAAISNINFGLLPDIQYGTLAGQVIINEVLTRTKNGNDQFIEISNVSGGPISLAGWQLVDGNIYVDDTDGANSLTGDGNNPSYVFPSGASLANGEYAVIWLGPNSGDTQAPAAGFQDWMDVADNLNRDGDELWLINASLGLIDYIAWGAGNDLNTPPPASLNAWNTVNQAEFSGVGKGQSLSLTRDSLDGNTSACWEMTTSDDASGRCSAFLPTIIGDDDAAAGRTSSAGLNNNGVTVVAATGVIVSGYLYNDANHNGQFNTDEIGTADSTIVLFNVIDNTCISVTTNNEGYYEFASVANGDYQLISADGEAVPTPATCPAAESDPSGTVSTTTNTREVNVAGVNIPNQNFGDYNGSIVRGNVFVDNGAGAGTAYNGILDGDEQASASVPIELLDGTTVLESVLTDASGGFELWVPSTLSNISIKAQTPSGYLSVTESVGNSGATVDTDRDVISFTALAGTTYTDLAFGDIATPAFAPDHKRSGIAGSFVVFPHTFTSEAPGDVSFSIINPVATPDMSGWSAILYLDEDCDGQLAASDPVINGSIKVDPDTNTQICTIAKVLIPAMADPNAQYLIEVESDMAFTGADIANNTSVRSDLTTVGLASEAGLIIVKSVDKTSALPGETLVYTIIYRNTSREPLDNIVVYDSTPVFTHFLSASCITPLPTSISNCAVTKAPAVNGSGSVAWTMTGKLDPDTEGTVVYKVGVDN